MPLDKTNNKAEVDYIYGAKAIARELNLEPRQVYHLHDKGGFPIAKMSNGKLFISREKARAYMDKLLEEAVVTHD
ncbi:hypothetical protein [Maricaulis sp.]|uniref:hypothetical protein n=1 Tax=Maricaulis sp. TaxID=1486257 RepID=UPI002631EC91|nr:hypothetical protein [Maricaulis sp.]MDF1770120.1 hypothetical protein [Maricaulis sp.]